MSKKSITLVLTLVVVNLYTSFVLYQNNQRSKELENQNIELQNDVFQLQEELNSTQGELQNIQEEYINIQDELKKSQEKYNNLEKQYNEFKSTSIVFNKNDLTKKSNVKPQQLAKVLNGTGLEGLENAYVNAEQNYGVNAIFLTALTIEESGWGNSSFARNKNNIAGIGSGSEGFSSKTECINYTASILSNNYLSEDGKYYKGKSIYDVNSTYCPTGYTWSSNISNIANRVIEKIKG